MTTSIEGSTKKWWILAAVCGAQALIVLDETIVGVALPTIRSDLGMTAVSSHWVVNGYLLVFTMLVAAAGKAADILGHNRLFLIGVALFGITSAAAGFAQNDVWLNSARVVQGIGAALIFPTAVAMIGGAFPPEQRGMAFGIQTAAGGIAMTLGPFVGGLFSDLLSWRWIFWVNLPVVLMVLTVILSIGGKAGAGKRHPAFDWWGLLTLVTGLGGLVFGLMEAPDRGWLSPEILVTLIGGAALFALFVVIELRVDNPLIEIDLLAIRIVRAGNLIVFTAQFNKITIVIVAALYLQQVLKMSALDTGIGLLAAVLPLTIASMMAGRLADRLGLRRQSIPALLINTLAILYLGVTTGYESYWLLVPGFVFWGATLPHMYVPTRRAVMAAIAPDKHGQAGGVQLTSQFLGGTIGMALCSTLLASTGNFQIVFLAVGGCALVLLVAAYIGLPRADADGAT